MMQNMNIFSQWPMIWKMYPTSLEELLRKNFLKELIEGNNTFDLMISETLYLNEIFVAFGHIFNVPVINIDSHVPSAWSCYLTGNVNPYAFVPNYRLPVTDHMSFKERALNTLMNVQEVLGSYYYHIPTQVIHFILYINIEFVNLIYLFYLGKIDEKISELWNIRFSSFDRYVEKYFTDSSRLSLLIRLRETLHPEHDRSWRVSFRIRWQTG